MSHCVSSLDTDTALKVSHSVYSFTTSISRVENYFLRLWGMGISDVIFLKSPKIIYHVYKEA